MAITAAFEADGTKTHYERSEGDVVVKQTVLICRMFNEAIVTLDVETDDDLEVKAFGKKVVTVEMTVPLVRKPGPRGLTLYAAAPLQLRGAEPIVASAKK